jgi:hypothetical protein
MHQISWLEFSLTSAATASRLQRPGQAAWLHCGPVRSDVPVLEFSMILFFSRQTADPLLIKPIRMVAVWARERLGVVVASAADVSSVRRVKRTFSLSGCGRRIMAVRPSFRQPQSERECPDAL